MGTIFLVYIRFSIEQTWECLARQLYLNETAIKTPHAQRERGKVNGRVVHIYIFITYLPRSLYIFQWRVAWDISPYYTPYITRYTLSMRIVLVTAFWIT